MKVVNVTHDTTSIPLGRLGENESTMVIFDVQDWLDEYPDMTIGLYNRLPNESTSYPAVISQPSNGKVTWTVTDTELAIVGNGQCELVGVDNETVVKGIIYRTTVYDALDGAGDAPDPWESWMTEFTVLKGEAETAANTSEAYAIGKKNGEDVGSSDPAYHNNSKYYSEEAEDSATAAETAQGLAEDAQEAAEAAQTAAETAQGKAEDAQEAAEAAQTAAETAQGLAEDAQEAAETAQTAAETAQGKAEDAQEAAETAQGAAEDSAEDAEAYAVGTRGGTDVSSDDPTYHNNSKYYSGVAEAAAETALTIIDDTAGDGDTDKTWSADKLTEELAAKYEKPSGGIPGTDIADSYIEEPSSDGTSGQVLTTDGSGGRSWTTVQGGGGTSDYSDLTNKPSINSVTLSGNKSLSDLGIASANDLSGKADKVSSATNGNLAALDSNGNLTDSGSKASDFGTYSKPSGGIPGTDLADSYIKEPTSDGTSGQVLTTDGNGGRTWTTPSGGVSDVQVNGTSVVSNGVANVPLATSTTPGVIIAGNGLEFNSQNGKLQTNNAGSNTIKLGVATDSLIVPGRQHIATFYGLAKAAGDSTQAASSNEVGTYTSDAKAAINSMFGSIPAPASASSGDFLCYNGTSWVATTLATWQGGSY